MNNTQAPEKIYRLVHQLLPNGTPEQLKEANQTMHDFYGAIYRICERIARDRRDGKLPPGSNVSTDYLVNAQESDKRDRASGDAA
jgi:hypothetical protein